MPGAGRARHRTGSAASAASRSSTDTDSSSDSSSDSDSGSDSGSDIGDIEMLAEKLTDVEKAKIMAGETPEEQARLLQEAIEEHPEWPFEIL